MSDCSIESDNRQRKKGFQIIETFADFQHNFQQIIISMSKIWNKIKIKWRVFWTWVFRPFVVAWMRWIVLPREDRMKKRFLKNPRLMNWMSQMSIALVSNGTYNPLIQMQQKAKKKKKKKLNRKKRAPSLKAVK